VKPIFTPRVFAKTLRASWAYLFAQAVRKAAAAARDPIVDGSAIERSLAFSSFEPSRGAVSALERGGAQGSLDPMVRLCRVLALVP
jgi:hypothetical protein